MVVVRRDGRSLSPNIAWTDVESLELIPSPPSYSGQELIKEGIRARAEWAAQKREIQAMRKAARERVEKRRR
jgi:hypothetical protein